MLDRNTGNKVIVCKFLLSKIATEDSKYLLRIIIISHLEPYNIVQIIGVR